MLSERTIINGLILVAGMILGPYLVASVLEGNGWPLLIFGGSIFLLIVFFIIKDGVCILPLLGLSYIGKLKFLPLGFTALEVASFLVIFYYGITYLALKQRTIRWGPFRFLFPILVLVAIIIYHDHSVGLHVMGSSQEGSRPSLLICIAIVTYICGINIPTPSIAFLKWLPWCAVVITSLSVTPFILSTYFPSVTPVFFYFTDVVNINAYVDSQSSVAGSQDIGRSGLQAAIGAALQVFLVSHFPVHTWWRPDRWFVVFLSILCFLLVVNGGYRSGLMLFFFVTLVGLWCYISWRTLALLPLAALGLCGLSFVQDNHPWGVELPLIAQRSLTWLPGKWDEEAILSAKSSNDFRDNIQRVYIEEYLHKSPWIGNGFMFDPNETQILIDLAAKSDTYDHYYTAKSFIISKTFHVGWISLYDAVGLIGAAAFITLGATVLRTAGGFIFCRGVDQRSMLFPLKVWIFCNVSQALFGYFTVFGSFGGTLPSLCAYSIVLVHLERMERRDGLKEKASLVQQQSLERAQSGRLFPA